MLLLNHIGSHAASSPLQGASALARADRFAGSQHAARNPCSTLAEQLEKRALGHVQSPFLGSFIKTKSQTGQAFFLNRQNILQVPAADIEQAISIAVSVLEHP
jgi:hypothetical protein